jgi:hypothetical protein
MKKKTLWIFLLTYLDEPFHRASIRRLSNLIKRVVYRSEICMWKMCRVIYQKSKKKYKICIMENVQSYLRKKQEKNREINIKRKR